MARGLEDGENRAVSVEHYENFPVASLLCPPALRPPIAAIYHYARTADDIADEGDAPPSRRLADLAAYRADLAAVCAGRPPSPRWAGLFAALARALRERSLPPRLLHDLLDAFEQDVRNPPYPDRAALLDYCRRSADPVGRLLLHLHGIADAASLRRSDAICSALQLINFWQDLGLDLARGRHYVPDADLAAHGLTRADLEARRDTAATRALVAALCDWAEGLMREGAPLALRLPGRAGWELRLVVQGGLRILEKIRRMDHAALTQRPTIAAADAPALLWRAARMGTTA
ncbi:MAG: squalene synthase HpnC [Burkholderiales bacterium]|nr:squalene synthase HpnC [Burkholderiales bacterium]MDE1925681.1 squalene synthase HpnC [Burkholderiales bacterium]MDE2161330.1 squalene synthase HpnC [Burkholderiales bacterium]MDE2504317.1 squalene synthase HpnC [Burkholderiales bacterium]